MPLTSVSWFTYQDKGKTYFQSVQKKLKQNLTQKEEINSPISSLSGMDERR